MASSGCSNYHEKTQQQAPNRNPCEGSIQSIQNPAIPGKGTVYLSGSEQCKIAHTPGGTAFTYCDGGNVSVTVKGHTTSTTYGGCGESSNTDTASIVAGRLAAAINADSGAFVTATAANGQIALTSKSAGASTDYSLSGSSATVCTQVDPSTGQPIFPPGSTSFPMVLSGSTLTGGQNSSTTYDSGTVSAMVNGCTASTSYSETGNNSAAAVANGLSASLGGACASQVSASASGDNINLTTTATGPFANDYTLSATSATSDPSQFSSPSFTASASDFGGGSDFGGTTSPWTTFYTYNALNDLTGVTQNGSNSANARVRSFQYDSLSRLVTATNPESGAITYAYDPNGNLSTKVAPKPNQTSTATVTTSYTYDVLNRLTKKSYVSTPNALYGYDGTSPTNCNVAVPTIKSATNLIGRMSFMCSGDSSSAFSYDPMGRPSESRKNKGSVVKGYSVNYTYYLDGSVNTLTYPSGNIISYTVGGAERVTQVSDSTNNYVVGAAYAPPGLLTNMTSGSNIVTNNIYNDRLQPILLSAAVTGNAPFFSLCYDFHLHVAINSSPCAFNGYSTGDNGNVFQVINNVDSTRSAAFQYDMANRITQANTINTTSSNCWSETYTIDAWGNLTNRGGVSGMGTCYTEGLSTSANTQNQLSILSYDSAGNVINDGNGNTPTYDAENRVVTDAGMTYNYDAKGVRIEKSSGTSGTMYWPGEDGAYLTETDLTGTITEEYVYVDGQRLARIDQPSGTVHYYFSDHLGSGSVITDTSGNVQAQYFYYPYGGIVSSTGTDTNHYKFTGKERDSESGLDYFGARHYASSMGRWMVPDRLNLTSARLVNPTNTLNKYVYGGNNPLKYIDKDGKDITIFYRPPSGASGDYGHIMLGALNQATGKVGFLDYYPAGNVNGLGQGPGAFNTGNMSERAAQNADGKFATLTIQTSPEEAQKVLDLIGALKNGSAPDYSALTNNCTTVCEDVLQDLGLDFGDVFPSSYWADVYNNFSADAQAHPIWTRMMGVHGTPGNEYGNPRNFPGVNNFSQWLFTLYQNQQQQPQPKACVEVDDGLGNHSKSCD